MLLLVTLWVVIQFSPVQTWLVKRASRYLSNELKTEVSVSRVDFSLFRKVLLEGILIKDQKQDTLVSIGRLGATANNWFFLKDRITIHNLSLEHATIYLTRSDSVWNYQFLIDYFSAPATGKQQQLVNLYLRNLNLSNIHIRQQDDWTGTAMEGKLSHLSLKANKISLRQQVVDIEQLLIDDPLFTIQDYPGKKPSRKKLTDQEYHEKYDTVQASGFGKWILKAGSVIISNGEFRNDLKNNRDPLPYFDGAHIRFFAINAGCSNLRLTGDSLLANADLSLKERSGFEVTRMTTFLNWHSRGMEFNNLVLETPYSRLTDYFALRYRHFNHDMNNFLSHVQMEGNFEKSKIHSDDIAFFAPELKNWKDVVVVTGTAKGTVDHLKGNKLHITTGKKTLLEGDFTIDGLPDIDNTFLDINAKQFVTNYTDAALIYPGIRSIKTPALQKINNLSFKGSFTGYLKDFVTYGTIQTNLGTIVSDINLKFPSKGEPIYSGKLKTSGFELGSFLNEKHIGTIEMDGYLKGKGFSLKTLFAEIDAKVQRLDLYGYTYRNIEAKGIADKKKFDGALVVEDEHLSLNLTGLVDASKDTVSYKLSGFINRLHAKELKLWKKDLKFSGDIDFNFKVKRIEDFTGLAFVQNASLEHEGKKLSFDSLIVTNLLTDAVNKRLEIRTNELEATVTGDFSIINLPDLTLQFLSNYFPAYIPKPKNRFSSQNFEFNVTTRNINPFLELLEVPLRGFEYATISGKMDVPKNQFVLNTQIPSFEYKKILFEQVAINGTGSLNQLSLTGTVGDVMLNDSLSLPNSSFTITAANDTGSVSIRTSATQTLKEARLDARFRTSKEGVTITFLPSTILLNEKTWTIEKESDFFIGKNTVISNGLRLNSGNEEIFAYTHPSETGTYNDVVVELRKVEMGDLLPYVLPDPRLEGTVTGRVELMNPFGKLMIDARLTADKFRFNNDSIGVVPIKGNYNAATGDINYSIESDNLNHEFTINGKTNILDLKNITTDNLLEINNESLSILSPYLSVLLTDIKGTGTGIVRVKGDGRKPELIGSVRLNNTSFILDYTKCRYFLNQGTVLNFREGAIEFGQMKLRDSENRSATFSGTLYHRFFNDMSFNLQFQTDDKTKGLQVLNTTRKDNTLFYGQVVAAASGSVTGPANNIIIKLQGEPTDSSWLYLPTSDSRVTGTASFIVFRKYGKDMKVQSEIKQSSAITVDLDVTANPYAKVFLILDEFTNDIIEGQGNGTLNLRVGTNEKTTMNGNFEITSGRYNFNWQSLFKRPFLINKGTISWNGDPYDARINIFANYFVEKVALLPELTNGCSNERSDIFVVANMKGTLNNPEIVFRFELPQGHPCRNNPLTNNALTQLYNNADELNRQVISLLLVGSFISANSNAGLATGNLGNTFFTNAAGTLSEFIAQQVTTGLDVVLKNIPGVKDLKLDPYVTFTPGLISGTQAQGMGFQGTGSFGFTRRLLNGRILIKAGGSLLVAAGQANTIQNNNQLTPDLSIEWLITPDGKLRLIGFYRSIFDVSRSSSMINRTGVSFSYVREFDKLW